MTDNDENNGWHEYKLLVIDRLDTLKDGLEQLTNTVNRIDKQVTAIKIKSGLWGAIAGSVPTLIGMLIYMIVKR